jgi:hypothetical protein
MRRWLALSVLVIGLTVGLSKASGTPVSTGLSVVGYSIDDVPPQKSDSAYPVCGTGWYEQINYTWDYPQNLFGECGWDSFMLHYTGFIQIPAGVESVRFGIASDDGSNVTIDGHTFGDWSDKGCSVDYSDRLELDTNKPLKLDAWFYENGGGTCFMLFWQFDGDNQDWAVVPWTAFTSELPPTTTLQETTTTTELPTTSTVPPTTVIFVPKTNPIPEPSVVVPPTSLAPTKTSSPNTSVPSQPVESSTTAAVTTSSVVDTTTSSTSVPLRTTTTTGALSSSSTTSSVPPIATTTTTVVIIPPEVKEIPPAEAVALATKAEVLKNVTPEEAKVIFQSIDETHLTDDQGLAIVNAVQNAPTSVRKAFEKGINIFGGHTDTYVPVGSVVSVKARRVIIVTGLLLAVPAVTPRRRK